MFTPVSVQTMADEIVTALGTLPALGYDVATLARVREEVRNVLASHPGALGALGDGAYVWLHTGQTAAQAAAQPQPQHVDTYGNGMC